MLMTALLAAGAIAAPATLYDFKMDNIDGKATPLAQYKGKVVLVVNTASKCGLTPQYEGLEALYRKYKDKGFVILGFPANNFNGQEPGTNAEIKEFCTGKYEVTFPMFSKISVKGDDQHPLYKWLIEQTDKEKQVQWNFEKFLIAKDGTAAGRFAPQTKPDDPKLIAAIEAQL